MPKDIHRETAAELFGVPEEKVTVEQRSTAKAFNFGGLYGSGRLTVPEFIKRCRMSASVKETA